MESLRKQAVVIRARGSDDGKRRQKHGPSRGRFEGTLMEANYQKEGKREQAADALGGEKGN